jgi:antitoxin component YwqK of YwqJK toxin-antitoxin module
LPTGRQKCWDENGDFVVEAYWIKGKKVSRKRYLEACKTDSELPQYPEPKSPISRKKA